jgi:hypothetical protein
MRIKAGDYLYLHGFKRMPKRILLPRYQDGWTDQSGRESSIGTEHEMFYDFYTCFIMDGSTH